MLHILEFDDIESQETKDLMETLSNSPNGITPYASLLKGMQSMLPDNKWLVHVNPGKIQEYENDYKRFSSTKGIKMFAPIDDDTLKRDYYYPWCSKNNRTPYDEIESDEYKKFMNKMKEHKEFMAKRKIESKAAIEQLKKDILLENRSEENLAAIYELIKKMEEEEGL